MNTSDLTPDRLVQAAYEAIRSNRATTRDDARNTTIAVLRHLAKIAPGTPHYAVGIDFTSLADQIAQDYSNTKYVQCAYDWFPGKEGGRCISNATDGPYCEPHADAIADGEISPMPSCNVIRVSGYRVLVEQAPDGGYGASVPRLPGCVALGDTPDHAKTEIAEAIQLHLEGLRQDLHTGHGITATGQGEDTTTGTPKPTEAQQCLDSLVEFQRDEWRIEIGVPRRVPMEQMEDLMQQISAVVERWQPEDRDWDTFLSCGAFSHTSAGWLTKAVSAVLDVCDSAGEGGTLTAEQIRGAISRNLPRATDDPETEDGTP